MLCCGAVAVYRTVHYLFQSAVQLMKNKKNYTNKIICHFQVFLTGNVEDSFLKEKHDTHSHTFSSVSKKK